MFKYIFFFLDRYIIIGSSHYTLFEENNKTWASGAAIMTSIISSIISKMKSGWRPQRTIIFCSWGGAPFGNIGSYKWGKVIYLNIFAPSCWDF